MNLAEADRIANTIITNEEPEEDEEDTGFHCPECGSTNWYRTVHGTYTEDYIRRFNAIGDDYHEDWENLDQDQDDIGDWTCYACGTVAPDYLAERIDDA